MLLEIRQRSAMVAEFVRVCRIEGVKVQLRREQVLDIRFLVGGIAEHREVEYALALDQLAADELFELLMRCRSSVMENRKLEFARAKKGYKSGEFVEPADRDERSFHKTRPAPLLPQCGHMLK